MVRSERVGSRLFSEYALGSVSLKNRIVMPPMCQWLSDAEGRVKDYHLAHYAQRAIGGAGLIIVEATAVASCGRISPNDLGIWDDAHTEGLSRLAKSIRQSGAVAGIQIGHAGRKAWVGHENAVAPSSIAFSDRHKTPEELDARQIDGIRQGFVDAAVRASRAGFGVLELHAAHGYLLHQFLSPISNRRTDGFGGTLDNRLRLTLSVLKEIREEVPQNVVLGLRVSACEYDSRGYQMQEMLQMCRAFEDAGSDFVHVSSGGATPIPIEVWPGYQLGFAKTIKAHTDMAVIGVGRLESPALAEFALREGFCDLVAIGSQMLRDPYWPCRAAAELGEAAPIIEELRPVFEKPR